MNQATKKLQVSHADMLRLSAWVAGNKDRLLRERPTREEAAS